VDGSAVFEKPLTINGGLLQVSKRLETKGRLTLGKGGRLTLAGPDAQFVPAGGLQGTNFTFMARDGAVIELPGLTTYDGPGDFTSLFPVRTSFRAQGLGTRLTLPDLISATGPVDWNTRGVPSLAFEAVSGGELQLPKLATLTGRAKLGAAGFGSTLNAPALGLVDGPDSVFPSTVEAFSQGVIQGWIITNLVHCNVTLEDDGILQTGSLELAESSLLRGVGMFNTNLVCRGTIALDRVPGSLVIAGNLEFTSTSVLDATLGLGVDRAFAGTLEVRGTTVLGGTLKLTKGNGYTPAAGQQFSIGTLATAPIGGFVQQDDSALGATVKANPVVPAQDLKVDLAPR
jgi:hypothetical protein